MKSFRRQRRSPQGVKRRGLLRRLLSEALERREMFASDVWGHHNPAISTDVNSDYSVTPLDALMVINRLNGSGPSSLNGVPATGEEYIDVDGDNHLTPTDALLVINALNSGQAETTTLATLQLDITKNNASILGANRQVNLNVGDEFDLEVLWKDSRPVPNVANVSPTGLFAVYADVLAKNSDKFIPVVGETFIIQATDQVTGGKVTLTANGKSVDLTPIQLSATEDVLVAFEEGLGFGVNNVRVVNEQIDLSKSPDANFPGATALRRVSVTFVGSDLVLKDLPDIGVNTSQLIVSSNAATAFKVSNTPALQNDNNDGTITPNEINPAAILANIDSKSRSITFGGQPAGVEVYPNGRSGQYNLTAPAVNGFQELFNEVGGFGGISNIAKLGARPFAVNLANPFEAFSLKLRAVAPTASSDPVVFQVDKSDGAGREVLLYDIAYENSPFNIPNKNDFIAIDSALGTVTLNFAAANVFTAVQDSLTINEDAPATTIDVLANDNNPGGGAVTIDSITQPALVNGVSPGTVSIDAVNNKIIFTPTKDFNSTFAGGNTQFSYTAKNAANVTSTANVVLTITAVNDPPTAVNKSLSTSQGQPVNITEATLLTGATTGATNESDTLTVSAVGTAANGLVAFNQATRTVTYTPNASFAGPTDSFTYTISDGTATVTATVNVTITAAAAVNAVDDAATVDGGSSNNTIQVLSNDTPAGTLTVTNVSTASSGTVTIASDGKSVLFTPAASSPASVTFTYTASNGANSDTATVTVTVNAINPAPNARDDSFTVEQGSGANVLNVVSNDDGGTGGESDTFTITAVTQPSNGSAVISNNGQRVTFTPSSLGSATFTYTITDSANKTATATVTVNVIAPVRPRAIGDEFTTAEEQAITLNIKNQLLANDLANAGQTLVLDTIATSVDQGGTLTFNDQSTATPDDDTITFTPTKDFNGVAKFTYRVREGATPAANVDAATNTVTITVTPVNDPPVAVNDQLGPINEDPQTPFDVAFTALTGNDNSGAANETQTLTVTAVAAVTANAGTVSIVGNAVRYTPAANFNGPFVFTYTLSDGQSANSTATGNATITVNAVNDNPIAVGDSFTVAEDPTNALQIPVATLLSNDSPGPASATDEAQQTLSVTVVSAASAQGGTVSLNAGVVSYRPANNFFGQDTFTYTLSDGAGGTTTGSVTVNVTSVNDAPTAANDTVQALQGQTLTITPATLLANDSAGPANENQTLTITAVNKLNATGTVVLNSNGSISYTPPAGSQGLTETFEYTVTDGVATATAQVTVNVQAFQPSSFKGSLFIDSDGDGALDSNEQVLGGIKVTLTGPTGTKTVVSNNKGEYEFTNLGPGTYTVAYAPASAVAVGGSPTSFNFTVGAQGGENFTGRVFVVKSLEPSMVELWNLLVTNYIVQNSNNEIVNSGGLTIQTDATGKLLFYRSEGGFSGAERVTATIDTNDNSVILDVLTTDGRVLRTTVPNNQKMVVKNKDGTYLIRIFGGLDSFTFTQVANRAQNATAFQNAVDQIFGGL